MTILLLIVACDKLHKDLLMIGIIHLGVSIVDLHAFLDIEMLPRLALINGVVLRLTRSEGKCIFIINVDLLDFHILGVFRYLQLDFLPIESSIIGLEKVAGILKKNDGRVIQI